MQSYRKYMYKAEHIQSQYTYRLPNPKLEEENDGSALFTPMNNL